MKLLSVIALGLATVAMVAGQTGNRKVTENPKSPTADTSITLGGHKIIIEYNAPSARGRKVEGGLIPYDKVWRFGADSATTLTTDADITIGGLAVPKGVHTLYILASEGGWKLIVNKQTGQWGTVYQESQDLGRAPLHLTKLSSPVETLKITLGASGASAGALKFQWGSTEASAGIELR